MANTKDSSYYIDEVESERKNFISNSPVDGWVDFRCLCQRNDRN